MTYPRRTVCHVLLLYMSPHTIVYTTIYTSSFFFLWKKKRTYIKKLGLLVKGKEVVNWFYNYQYVQSSTPLMSLLLPRHRQFKSKTGAEIRRTQQSEKLSRRQHSGNDKKSIADNELIVDNIVLYQQWSLPVWTGLYTKNVNVVLLQSTKVTLGCTAT